MSSQLYFYAAPSDVMLFGEAARRVGLLALDIPNFSTPFYTSSLFNHPEVLYSFVSCGFQFTHPALFTKKYFHVEPVASGYFSSEVPCLEISFQGIRDNKLKRSRCYFNQNGCPDAYSLGLLGPMIAKYYRTLKTQLKHEKNTRVYIAPEAAHMISKGVVNLDVI